MKLERAIKDYTEALTLIPNHFKSLFNRGYCNDRLGRLKLAK